MIACQIKIKNRVEFFFSASLYDIFNKESPPNFFLYRALVALISENKDHINEQRDFIIADDC